MQPNRSFLFSPVSLSILLVNVMILVMVVFLKPDKYIVIAAYFLETLIIGIFNVIKMTIISIFSPSRNHTPDLFPQMRVNKPVQAPNRMNAFLILFFILHFSIFYFVQLGLLTGLADGMDKHFPAHGGLLPNPVHFFRASLGQEGKYILLAILIMQVFALVYSFLIRGEYRVTNCLQQAMQPYGRIILQQLVVLVGGFFIIILQNVIVFSVLLILLKTIMDLYSQKKHDKKLLQRIEEYLAGMDPSKANAAKPNES